MTMYVKNVQWKVVPGPFLSLVDSSTHPIQVKILLTLQTMMISVVFSY